MRDSERRQRFVAWFDGPPMFGDRAKLIARTGISKGRVTQYFDPDQPFGERAAEALARKVGLPEDFFERTPLEPMAGATPVSGVSHLVRHQPFETPPTVTWESILNTKELPPRFCLAVPDDALNPRTPRGTVLIFETAAVPAPGDGVLVEDRHGGRHVRRYLPGLAGAWSAGVHDDAYLKLDSEQHGLTLLATATGRMSGAV